jgi:hypothetical protein
MYTPDTMNRITTISEGHYLPNNYRILIKLPETIHYKLKIL